MSADFWLGLQQDWDLWHALRSETAKEIARLEPLRERGWPRPTFTSADSTSGEGSDLR